MDKSIRNVIRRVLKAAFNAEHFFDYSDGERLNWMIDHAYHLGQRDALRTRRRRRTTVHLKQGKHT